MRNDQFTLLWVVWGVWGGVLVTYLLIHLSLGNWVLLATIWVAICSVAVVYFRYQTKRVGMFKAKKKMDVLNTVGEEKREEIPLTSEVYPLQEGRSSKETLIARGTVLSGEISNEADVMVEGSVIGDIHSRGVIRIGKEGRVQGTLTAEKITINGYLKGQCQATSVTILSQGRLDGDIHTRELSIERGGIFNGHSHHNSEQSDSELLTTQQEIAVGLPTITLETPAGELITPNAKKKV